MTTSPVFDLAHATSIAQRQLDATVSTLTEARRAYAEKTAVRLLAIPMLGADPHSSLSIAVAWDETTGGVHALRVEEFCAPGVEDFRLPPPTMMIRDKRSHPANIFWRHLHAGQSTFEINAILRETFAALAPEHEGLFGTDRLLTAEALDEGVSDFTVIATIEFGDPDFDGETERATLVLTSPYGSVRIGIRLSW